MRFLRQGHGVVWLVIGAIAGWLAGQIVRGYGFGLIGNIAVGIVGAAIGGIVLSRLGIFPVSTLGDIIAAVTGAVILLLLIGLVRRAT
jgi:uncharacterized membrane protein YeaQ/YmgE (transglycosylase-associated protein family)